MNKVLCSLLVLAIIGTAQCESFKRIHFDQGRTHIERNLETTTPAGRVDLTGKNENQTVIPVKLNEALLKNNSIEATASTTMAILLSSSETVFCSNCNDFVPIDCKEECKLDNSKYISLRSGKTYFTSGRQILNEGTYASLNTSWSLTTPPLVVSSGYIHTENFGEKSTYGVIGFGAEGNARKNFGVESPIFSVKVNATGKGALIFGNDTTQIQTNRKDKFLSWNTTDNWVADSTALAMVDKSIKVDVNLTRKSKVYFDLNQQGTYLYYNVYDSIQSALNLTYGNTDLAPFRYYYNATKTLIPFNKLPALSMIINGTNVTIPLEAYFKKMDASFGANCYQFMAERGSYESIYNGTSGSEEITIFGSYFLSNFYTVFSAPKDKVSFVQLHPIYTAYGGSTTTSSSGSGGKFLIGLIAVIGLGAVGFIVFRNKAASKLQEHLNEK